MAEQQSEHRTTRSESTHVASKQAKVGHGSYSERDTDRVVEDVSNTFRDILSKGVDSAETIGDDVRQFLQGISSGRGNAVLIRLDDATLARINIMVDAGVMDSRSDAAVFLIGEGIKARQPLFDRIDEKLQQIHAVKDELRHMAGEMNEPPAN